MSETICVVNGRVILPDGMISRQNLLIRNDTIWAVGGDAPQGAAVVDAREGWILPGFIDVHTHGADGVDANGATDAEYDRLSLFFASHGCTAFLPAVMTDSEERMLDSLRTAARAARRRLPGAQVAGIHLEGPFLSPDYKGAMPAEQLRLPDIALFERFQQAAGGAIRVVTLAPELPGASELIQSLTRSGVRVSLGHSAAGYQQGVDAIAAGAAASTHTGNAMRPIDRHDPAISGAALESDIFCELIADGLHLHPGFVRLVVKTKGSGRILPITDSVMATGKPDGFYRLGSNDIIVENGDALLADRSARAGSTLTADRALRNLRQFTALDLATVSRMMSQNPADYLGLGGVGRIAAGQRADLVILNQEEQPLSTVVGGVPVWTRGAPASPLT